MTGTAICRTVAGVLWALMAGAAGAADPGMAAAAREEFLRERAACDRYREPEARKTCRREAGAAMLETRRGTLAEGEDFEANRVARCAVHRTAEDRGYCERRMRGEGTVSGSIEGGGLLRELKVTVPAE